MLKTFIAIGIITSCLIAAQNKDNTKSPAERGAYFYEFAEDNATASEQKPSITPSQRTMVSGDSKESIVPILKELLKVAQEQKEIQQQILNLLSEEFHPTPQKVVINGKECIANSNADCFVMPVTKDAQRIPVLKELIVNPTPETAKNYLQWQAKYFSTGPFQVGRSFQYAINTYGEEAYPMNLTRMQVNTNWDELGKKREEQRQEILNTLYASNSVGLYIFLHSESLDYFALEEIGKSLAAIGNKKAVTLVFENEKDKQNVFKSIEKTTIEAAFKGASIMVNNKVFKANNIYMTPTYTVAINTGKKTKKQAVAIGRLSTDELNRKIYTFLEDEQVVKKGELSDYKVWNQVEEK